MTAAVAARMTGADILKLRKKRSTVIWSLVLVLLPIVAYFIVAASLRASEPLRHGPAGGIHGFSEALRFLAMFFGPLAAILVGVEAGAADAGSGVFRDLVVTGRERTALFASRVPAAIAITWAVVCVGYVFILIGTLAFASGQTTPGGSEVLNGLGFSLLSTGVICTVAVGFGSLTASRPAALVALIGWQLIASPILAMISSLGSPRRLLLSQAIGHFSPVSLGNGGHGVSITMSTGTAIIVLALWVVVFLILGAWRTRTMDA